jgi:acetyltransferase
VVEPGEQILDQVGVPTFAYPDTAARTFTAMWRSYYDLQALSETPTLPVGGETAESARKQARAIITTARDERRSLLTEAESKRILAAYAIPTVETRVALT